METSITTEKWILAAAAALLCIVSFVLFDAMTAIISGGLGCAMLAIAHEDAKSFIVPDLLSLPAIPAGLLVTKFLATPEASDQLVVAHLAAAILFAAALWAVRSIYGRYRGAEGLGLGDVKLGAVAGAWTGLQGVGPVLLLSCISALCFVAYVALVSPGKMTGKTAIPFGCFLAPSIWFVWSFYQL